jgi:hypothetical protein
MRCDSMRRRGGWTVHLGGGGEVKAGAGSTTAAGGAGRGGACGRRWESGNRENRRGSGALVVFV